MKPILCLFLSLFLVACSSTEIHLYSRYLTDDEVKRVTKKLEEANFKVIPNDLLFPETITHSSLIYSPFIRHDSAVGGLIGVLNEIGWSVQNASSLVSGNHWYSKNNVALLLLPDGFNPQEGLLSQDIAHLYASRNCNTDIGLQLNKNNTYRLTFNTEDGDNNTQLNGRWRITGFPYIELKSNDEAWWFYFKIEQRIETDQIGSIEIVELLPVTEYELFPNCSFVYGVRNWPQ
ncbi:hypothetical protein SAMN06297280_0647 [Arsukibacterium tuosuense]|uniref:Lipoprotein n=1 Tax=Arsukibacterium tuosuense TaxID=1323745 RepID=A0A285I755_9GAMM|nr:hypothetical protein [Arsukibacterium tuosuense]SNY43798.1 hypothetical protein SAMN06297280_0647 [Arsukibacterium tuosuense]